MPQFIGMMNLPYLPVIVVKIFMLVTKICNIMENVHEYL